MTPDAARLADIRARLDAVAGLDWMLAGDGAAMIVEVVGEGAPARLATFDAHASSDEMRLVADALADRRFLIGLVDRAVARLRGTNGHQIAEGGGSDRSPPDNSGAPAQGQPRSGDAARERNYAAEAAMKCREPAFKVFLEERHGLARPLTDERAAGRLRSLLGVTSRAELNDGGAALERWKQIRAEFREWQGRER